ncbi:hypothetical protein SAMN05216262_13114 [Colwellia chukchiensis]|uniref:Lipoprotein n=1 Tax=Colwellia chukchiensis TaxID=641665 RepID=A0A1H7U0D7_9GAMM|nr:hypothetical protein [Colwellia chukchiensis]SEL90126.1 hypothetical protein SAMN05216262_13114 [Colwellia chukchiensis]
MKKLITASLICLISACSTTIPDNSSNIEKNISVEHDSFKNQTWIKTPLYLSRQGFTDTFPVKISYRALLKKGELKFIQLYVTSTSPTWGFYHSAKGEDGHSFSFNKIDSIVNSELSVSTTEHFGLTIPLSYLQKMGQKDWKIKVYGKRNEGVFVVPNSLSQAFLNKLK